jgi:hypothetical protein
VNPEGDATAPERRIVTLASEEVVEPVVKLKPSLKSKPLALPTARPAAAAWPMFVTAVV